MFTSEDHRKDNDLMLQILKYLFFTVKGCIHDQGLMCIDIIFNNNAS